MFSALTLPGGGSSSSTVAAEDLDGDGAVDLVFANYPNVWYGSSGTNVFLLNNASGSFVDVTSARMANGNDQSTALVTGDVDNDGDADVIVGNALQNRLYVNLLRQLHAPTAAQLGQPYHLDAYMRYGEPSAVDLAAIYVSNVPASIPMSSLGTVGIDPSMAVPFPVAVVPPPQGVTSVTFTIPNQPSLVGLELHSQAALVGYPDDLRLSNVVFDVIQ
ncbi:MAG: VCBS repeat-containing protein [Planctomycetes bacterium]|nr:VCBS repeat-containing protein [Planctomycetota bacterium]